MDIRVSGHQVATGDAFTAHVQERLGGIASKYFARAIGAQVTLATGPHDNGFTCNIVMHVMSGLILKGAGSASVAQPAFDAAAERIEKQLRRYMRRLKSRHTGAPTAGPEGGADMAPADAFDFNAGYTVFDPAADAEDAPDAPLVVAETRVDIPDATVGDAVMMLDLRNTTALLFRNAATGTFNMVYRREDGNIGWVEPSLS